MLFLFIARVFEAFQLPDLADPCGQKTRSTSKHRDL